MSHYTEIYHPQTELSRKLAAAAVVLGASWAIAISAQVSIPVPFSPVPITAQTLAILLTGWILGKNRAPAAVGLYLAQGAMGLPFFAGGGSGWQVLVGPTGGYLAGFLIAAFVVGMLQEIHYGQRVIYTALALLVGSLLIYLPGLLWLVRFVGESRALQLGLYPFLIGDALKIMLGTVILCGGYQIAGYLRLNPDLK